MANIQMEIRYRIAYQMLKKLVMDGLISREEFEAAHSIVIDEYSPESVCRLP